MHILGKIYIITLIPIIVAYIKMFVCIKLFYLEFFTRKDLTKFQN